MLRLYQKRIYLVFTGKDRNTSRSFYLYLPPYTFFLNAIEETCNWDAPPSIHILGFEVVDAKIGIIG